MEIVTQTREQVTIAQIKGDIDGSTAPTAQGQLFPLVQPGCKLILDMTGVNYMSSAGLRLLLSLYRQVSANQGKIVLVGLSPEVKDTMDMTGFLTYFETSDSIEDGLLVLS